MGAEAPVPQAQVNTIPETDRAAFVPGRLLVKFRPGVELQVSRGKLQTNEAELNAVLEQVSAISAQRVFPDFSPSGKGSTMSSASASIAIRSVYLLTLDPRADVLGTVDTLNRDPRVEYAEPDYIALPIQDPEETPTPTPTPTPYVNDPLYIEQWNLATVRVESAWEMHRGSPLVTIAIVDSGIDLNHPDLMSGLWTNPGEIPDNGVDDDNNGYVDDVHGWNFVSGTEDVSDWSGHGSLVAGVAAARTNNLIGIAGVCGNCRIMPVKVMQPSGAANYSAVAAGIVYAANKGARVINLSLGGYSDSQTLRDAVAYADSLGSVVIAGAGNDNTSALFYPAACDEALAVAGTTDADTRSLFSNYGTWVDISAPDEAILSTALDGGYASASGTSVGTPLVSGLAGLLLSMHPEWTPAMVRSQLTHTADSIDALNPGHEGKLGSGRANAERMLLPPSPILTLAGINVNGTPDGRPDFGATSSLVVSVRNDWAEASGVTGSLATADPYVAVVNGTASYGNIQSGRTVTNTTLFTVSIATGAGYNHAIPFTLALSASGGYTSTLTFTVTTRSSEQSVAGTIAANTIWTNDKVYVVNNNLGVAPGFTLTIQAGTVVKFNGNYALSVGGTLIADGTAIQPIVFEPHSAGGTWNRIYFDNPSIDAVVDMDGTYREGTILRHVQVQGAANGLVCSTATPYMANVTTDRGGVNCAMGATPLWLLDSKITGNVSASGTGYVWRSTINSGTLSLGLASEVLTSTVDGGITAGNDSAIRLTSAGGGITIGGIGTVENSTAGGSISLSSGAILTTTVAAGSISVGTGTAIRNRVTGGNISLTSGLVLSNTVRSGGISAGAGSTVSGNDVQDAPGTGISTSGAVTVSANRVVGSGGAGIIVSTGLVQGNLIAGAVGGGLRVGAAAVLSNTLTGNSGVALYTSGGVPPSIAGNNFEFNRGQYDIYNDNASGQNVLAQQNWWGTTDAGVVAGRVYDYYMDYNKSEVIYTPLLTTPSIDAPAYVRGITLTPPSPVGLETAVFDVLFSRPMDSNTSPAVEFYVTRRGIRTTYSHSNSGLASDGVEDIAVDEVGNKWIATQSGVSVLRPDGTWRTYNRSNSGLAEDWIISAAVDAQGNAWFGGEGVCVSVLRADGTWTYYNTGNSGLAQNYIVAPIVTDDAGNVWFGYFGNCYGLTVFRANGTWHTYTVGNSGLGGNCVSSMAVDGAGRTWIGTRDAGASVLQQDGTWRVYRVSNSGLASDNVRAVATDGSDNTWFGTQAGAASLLKADGTWHTYDSSNSSLSGAPIVEIATDRMGNAWMVLDAGGAAVARADGTWEFMELGAWPRAVAVDVANNKWFGTWGGGVIELGDGPVYSLGQDGTWSSPHLYRAAYDITTLIARDAYSIAVSGAIGLDGIEIAPNVAHTFTIDYAGSIADTTPPPVPAVTAWNDGTNMTLGARWSVTDPDSAITLYRYAIGTAPGATDVVNWTNSGVTETVRSGLNLRSGQTYYVAVRARNEGGLWSEAGVSSGVAAGYSTQVNVRLYPGWNLVSIPVRPPNTATANALSSISGHYDMVWAYDATNASNPWKKYKPGAPSYANTLTSVTERMGLWIHATSATTLTLVGQIQASSSIPLVTGWNLVGYATTQTKPITEALTSIAGTYLQVQSYDVTDVADPWKLFDPAVPPPINDLTRLEPGRGYWIKLSQPGTLNMMNP
jgi:hypothetical protein